MFLLPIDYSKGRSCYISDGNYSANISQDPYVEYSMRLGRISRHFPCHMPLCSNIWFEGFVLSPNTIGITRAGGIFVKMKIMSFSSGETNKRSKIMEKKE